MDGAQTDNSQTHITQPDIAADPRSAEEMEKLKLEVAELRWKLKWFYRIGQIVSILSASIALSAFVVSVYQYNRQQAYNAKIAAEASDREFRKPVWERQLGLAFEISNVAATIATNLDADSEERTKAEARFWQLYYGPAIFLEGEPVKSAMIKFGLCLQKQEDCGTPADQSARLQELSLDLTNKCRSAMGLTWQLQLEDLYKSRTRPVPSPLP